MQEHTAHIDENAIRAKAHELWIKRGCPNGSADEDWYQAERLLRTQAQLPAQAVALSSPSEATVQASANGSVRQRDAVAPQGKGTRQRGTSD